MLAAGAGPASAHDQLLESTPTENAALDSPPTEVTLTYSDSVLTIGAIVLLVDIAGKNWAGEDPTLDGPTVTASVIGELPDGAYEIRWRVVSIDGHPISGIVPFTVGDAEPAAQTPSSSAPSDEPISASDAAPSSQAADDALRTVLVGIGGAAAAVLLLWAVTAWNRHRRANSTTRTPTP
ncbi:MAG: copper resistance protein CopC [Microbacteriaceae bacterium]|nr:copper resistance protein CopC [Microbacteriaceae bacterium]